MIKTSIAVGTALAVLAGALFLAFRLGFFAPSLAQVEGQPIGETPLVDLEGHKHTFHELRGRAVTLYFWATWCSPCLKHLARLGKAGNSPASRRFLPIALESDPSVVATTLQRIGYHGPMWIATDGMSLLQRRFAGNDKRGVPFQVDLSASGRILGATYGG